MVGGGSGRLLLRHGADPALGRRRQRGLGPEGRAKVSAGPRGGASMMLVTCPPLPHRTRLEPGLLQRW